jgi:hypothetical protein
MSEPEAERLSPAGQARREAMLDELLEVVKRTQRARRLRRRATVIGGCAGLVLLFVVFTWPGAPGPAPQVANLSTGQPTDVRLVEAPRPPACITSVVETDVSVLARYRAVPQPVVARMDDRMLVQTLASIGRPAGLIRFGDDVRLSRPVTDAELNLNQ